MFLPLSVGDASFVKSGERRLSLCTVPVSTASNMTRASRFMAWPIKSVALDRSTSILADRLGTIFLEISSFQGLTTVDSGSSRVAIDTSVGMTSETTVGSSRYWKGLSPTLPCLHWYDLRLARGQAPCSHGTVTHGLVAMRP